MKKAQFKIFKKKVGFVIALLVVIGVFINSCNKKEESEIIPKKDIFTCKVGGVQWLPTSFYAGLSDILFGLSGTSSDGSSVDISIEKKDFVAGKTITLSEILAGGANAQLQAGYNIGGIFYTPFEGSIKISSVSNNRAIGIFSFKAYDNNNTADVKVITDGIFNVYINKE
jgi:hypothetical protein